MAQVLLPVCVCVCVCVWCVCVWGGVLTYGTGPLAGVCVCVVYGGGVCGCVVGVCVGVGGGCTNLWHRSSCRCVCVWCGCVCGVGVGVGVCVGVGGGGVLTYGAGPLAGVGLE